MAGPYERQLRAAVAAMKDKDVTSSDSAWTESAENLAMAAKRLKHAAKAIREGFGEYSEVSEHGSAAFRKAAKRASRRSRQMRRAAAAIAQANEAMGSAQRTLDDMGKEPRHPGGYTPNPSQSSKQQLRAQSRHGQRMRDYQDRMADREDRSRAALADMDATYADSSATMQKIHGEPDQPPPPTAGRPESPGVTAHPMVVPGAATPAVAAPPTAPDLGVPAGPTADITQAGPLWSNQPGLTGVSGAGAGSGLSAAAVAAGLGATGLGALGRAGLAGTLARGGGVGLGTSRGGAPLGGSTRTAAAGSVLGRGGSGGAGSGAGRGGARSGKRGGAGSRSTLAGAGAAGSRKRGDEDERKPTDRLTTEGDWLDDQDGGPAVLG